MGLHLLTILSVKVGLPRAIASCGAQLGLVTGCPLDQTQQYYRLLFAMMLSSGQVL
jgi:hypothetical protein